jgi:hypothetical protein
MATIDASIASPATGKTTAARDCNKAKPANMTLEQLREVLTPRASHFA